MGLRDERARQDAGTVYLAYQVGIARRAERYCEVSRLPSVFPWYILPHPRMPLAFADVTGGANNPPG